MSDEDYFFLMCERMNKMPTEAQLDEFLRELKHTIRVKAFVIAMRL